MAYILYYHLMKQSGALGWRIRREATYEESGSDVITWTLNPCSRVQLPDSPPYFLLNWIVLEERRWKKRSVSRLKNVFIENVSDFLL